MKLCILRILFDNKIIYVECEGDNHIQRVSNRWLLLRRNEKCETYQSWLDIWSGECENRWDNGCGDKNCEPVSRDYTKWGENWYLDEK